MNRRLHFFLCPIRRFRVLKLLPGRRGLAFRSARSLATRRDETSRQRATEDLQRKVPMDVHSCTAFEETIGCGDSETQAFCPVTKFAGMVEQAITGRTKLRGRDDGVPV